WGEVVRTGSGYVAAEGLTARLSSGCSIVDALRLGHELGMSAVRIRLRERGAEVNESALQGVARVVRLDVVGPAIGQASAALLAVGDGGVFLGAGLLHEAAIRLAVVAAHAPAGRTCRGTQLVGRVLGQRRLRLARATGQRAARGFVGVARLERVADAKVCRPRGVDGMLPRAGLEHGVAVLHARLRGDDVRVRIEHPGQRVALFEPDQVGAAERSQNAAHAEQTPDERPGVTAPWIRNRRRTHQKLPPIETAMPPGSPDSRTRSTLAFSLFAR